MNISPPLKKCYFCKEIKPAWYQLTLAPSRKIVYSCDDCYKENIIKVVKDNN